MEQKKNPKVNLQNYSKVFLLLGLVFTLFTVYVAVEHKTYDDMNLKDLGMASLDGEDEEEMVITERLQPVKPPPPPPPPPPPEIVEIVDDDEEIEEVVFETTETEEDEEVEVVDVEEAEEVGEIEEDVPFMILQESPIFPGCKGKDQKKLKECFTKKIKKHVNRKFDVGLAEELGLSPGKKRISVLFKIDKTGVISEVMARGPHPRLEKEAERTIRSLPKMIPGKQHNKPVGVKYSIPITFLIE